MSAGPVGVALVGAGVISTQYLTALSGFPDVRVLGIADLDVERARAAADAYGVPVAGDVASVLAVPEVEIVVNLTVPAAHAEVASAALRAGKHVYGEKPLALTTTEGAAMLRAATAAGVRLGCAPDTVLGTGLQTARKALDDGLIGTPVAAAATMVTPGHERWHPNPDFYYAPGGGPLFDMGPYYLSALVTLLGPVERVLGATSRARPTRTIGAGPRQGECVPVSVDTHVTGVLVHTGGALSTLLMSFDAVASVAAPIEVHGTLGSLVVPDPNRFEGTVQLRALGTSAWQPLPVSAGFLGAGRGYGLADLAVTPPTAEPRASAALALHVLDIMQSLLEAARRGRAVRVRSTCQRPRAVPLGRLS
jgi:predicted dehydrogenase